MNSDVQDKINRIIDKHKRRNTLLSILQDVQDEFAYLPKDVLIHIKNRLSIPLTQIYGVITFYDFFSLEARGRHLIMVCTGTTCHVKGAGRLLEKLERELKVKSRGLTKDLKFSLETVHCLGCCSLAPVLKIDSKIYGKVKQSEIPEMLRRHE